MSNITVVYSDKKGSTSSHKLEDLIFSAKIANTKVATFFAPSILDQFALIQRALQDNIVPVLYDNSIKSIDTEVSKLLISNYNQPSQTRLVDDAYVLFFTSGTTSNPTGVIKSRSNIYSELKALVSYLKDEQIKRVISTVSFVHIYGFLTTVLLPLELGCELHIKEQFWPQELLLDQSSFKTLVVTTPVYIKSLLKLRKSTDLSHLLFLSSTSRLEPDEIEQFETKYNTTIIQIFGSTESGGIATKRGTALRWQALDGVEIGSDIESHLTISSKHISKYIIKDEVERLKQPFVTTDIVQIYPKGEFELKGRAGEIVKISGKRISIAYIEELLERELEDSEVLIKVQIDHNRLKGESLLIGILSKEQPAKALVEQILAQEYQNIKIEFALTKLQKIERTSLGKKIRAL